MTFAVPVTVTVGYTYSAILSLLQLLCFHHSLSDVITVFPPFSLMYMYMYLLCFHHSLSDVHCTCTCTYCVSTILSLMYMFLNER